MEATCYSTTLVITHNTKFCHTPEHHSLKFQNSYKVCNVFDIDVNTGCIGQRYVVAIMGFLAVANAYTMRICLSTAITEMVVHHDRNESKIDPDACPSSSVSNNKTAPVSTFIFCHYLSMLRSLQVSC
jgi:hypothetical protein